MNVKDIQNSLTQSFGRGGLYLQKHSPEILLGAGLIGMVATVIMASKATLKANDIVEETKRSLNVIDNAKINGTTAGMAPYSVEDAMKDKAIVYVQTGLKFGQLYGPAASVGLLSLTAILASHGVMRKRQVALVAAYNLLKEGYDNYRRRVVEDLGEETDKNYYLGLKDESHTETEVDGEGNKKKVKKTNKALYDKHMAPSIYSRFFDESNPMWRTDRTLNKAFLIAQQNYLNDVLIIRGHVYLNEAYERLGFDHTEAGAIVGWVLKDPESMKEEGRAGYINFGIFDVNNDPGREFVNGTNPSILLDFNVDGIMFNQI
jgi:hypothetical protein